MTTATKELRSGGPSLNTVALGLSLAADAILSLRAGSDVVLNLTEANRMTPSFANALVMTILDAVGLDVFNARVRVQATGLVAEAWSSSVQRYERGIRLSTSLPTGTSPSV